MHIVASLREGDFVLLQMFSLSHSLLIDPSSTVAFGAKRTLFDAGTKWIGANDPKWTFNSIGRRGDRITMLFCCSA